MKRYILAGIALGTLVSVGNALATRGETSSDKERAVVEFADKTILLDVVLQGKYLFEHDDGRMARGEACMYVYKYEAGKAGELVVSFHCKPVERQAARITVTSIAATRDPDVFELKEIQFAGSNKGHFVPALKP
ncbi:MAG: hypothetical protein L0229_13440 [Blastocatellia bacterium]|nr:hypothetical protein [Blastocatellia bacterium]